MAPTSAPITSAKRVALLINRNFALLWMGQGISVIGDQVFNTTLVVWIGAVLTQHVAFSALALSGVLIAAALPALFIAPLAGVFVDRWDRRRTMIVMDALRAVIVVALLPAAGILPLPILGAIQEPLIVRLGVIYAGVFLASVCAQFFNPARFALVGDVVDEISLARASGLSQSSQSFAAIIGPPLAAPLLFGFGVQWALLINALSFVMSCLSILAIRPSLTAARTQREQHRRLLSELRQGISFTVGSRVLIAILVSAALVVMGAGALNALLIYFVTQNLHTQAALYGFIGAAEGVGALLGAVLASVFAQRIGVARMYAWSIVVAAVLLLVTARMTMFIPALIVIALLGIAEAAMNVGLSPLVLLLVPRELLGRVASLLNPLIVLAGLVGTALAGYLDSQVLTGFHAQLFGQAFHPIDTIYMAAGAVILLGGLYATITLRTATPRQDVIEVG